MVDQGYFDGANVFFKCRYFRAEKFFCKRPFFKMSFIRELCRDKEPEVPRNNVNNNSITEPDGMFPFFIFVLFYFFVYFYVTKQKQRKFD